TRPFILTLFLHLFSSLTLSTSPPHRLLVIHLCKQMSQIFTPSPKHCAIANKRGRGFFTNHTISSTSYFSFTKKLFYFISTLFTSILCFIFILWFTLRPSKPNFSLQQADIYQLTLSSSSGPNLLNSSIQLTLLSVNPNQRVGIYYDEFLLYASYKGQQITADSSLPAFYQGRQDTNVLTASLAGRELPVGPSFRYEVAKDHQVAGKLVLSLKGKGKLRWKVGSWVSGRYRFNVNCVAVMPFGPSAYSGPLTAKGTQCSIDV
ncbi:NDR1/HIN1-like protein 26, partial [Linum grandiflorum]